MPQNAITAVITIMLALIIKAALETAFKPVFDVTTHLTWHDLWGLPIAQLVIFFVITLRFYLGTLRFAGTEPEKIDFVVRAFNFFFAFLVFCAFYVLALSVTLPGYFYVEIVALHVIDLCWFGLLWIFSHVKYVPSAELKSGEFPIEPIRRLMVFYFSISTVTAAFGYFGYTYFFGVSLSDANATTAHWSYLLVLLLLSLFDLWGYGEYYFEFDAWKAKYAKR